MKSYNLIIDQDRDLILKLLITHLMTSFEAMVAFHKQLEAAKLLVEMEKLFAEMADKSFQLGWKKPELLKEINYD